MFPETAAAPFESDAEGGGFFQSFEFGGRWESEMSLGTTGEGWATWVGECCSQLDAFEYTSIVCRWVSLFYAFFSLFPFSVARRYCCCTFPDDWRTHNYGSKTGVTEPQKKRGE
jgi:hypothetical protein